MPDQIYLSVILTLWKWYFKKLQWHFIENFMTGTGILMKKVGASEWDWTSPLQDPPISGPRVLVPTVVGTSSSQWFLTWSFFFPNYQFYITWINRRLNLVDVFSACVLPLIKLQLNSSYILLTPHKWRDKTKFILKSFEVKSIKSANCFVILSLQSVI